MEKTETEKTETNEMKETEMRKSTWLKKLNISKKQFAIFLLSLAIIFIYTGWYVQGEGSSHLEEDIIRFHVVANSDLPKDQELKLKVRDSVLEFINQELLKETIATYDTSEDIQRAIDASAAVANLAIENEEIPVEESSASSSESSMDANTEKAVDAAIAEVNLTRDESLVYLEENLAAIENVAEEIIRAEGYNYTVTAEIGVRWIPEKVYGDITVPAGNYKAFTLIIGDGEGENWWCVLYPPLCLIAEPENVHPEEIKLTTEPELKLKFKTLELLER